MSGPQASLQSTELMEPRSIPPATKAAAPAAAREQVAPGPFAPSAGAFAARVARAAAGCRKSNRLRRQERSENPPPRPAAPSFANGNRQEPALEQQPSLARVASPPWPATHPP